METKRNPFRKSLLFVCLGNICRSPAAEGVMKKLVAGDRQLDGFVEVDSAGIGSWHTGQLPDSRMRACGARRGYDFSSRARQVRSSDFGRFDYVFAMDRENEADLESLARSDEDRAKILCLADFLTSHPQYHTVPDPYYGSEKDFDIALDLIEDACAEVVRRLKEEELF